MKAFATEIIAICPKSGDLLKWCGCTVYAPSWEAAEQWLNNNGMGYCKVVGELVQHEEYVFNLN